MTEQQDRQTILSLCRCRWISEQAWPVVVEGQGWKIDSHLKRRWLLLFSLSVCPSVCLPVSLFPSLKLSMRRLFLMLCSMLLYFCLTSNRLSNNYYWSQLNQERWNDDQSNVTDCLSMGTERINGYLLIIAEIYLHRKRDWAHGSAVNRGRMTLVPRYISACIHGAEGLDEVAPIVLNASRSETESLVVRYHCV